MRLAPLDRRHFLAGAGALALAPGLARPARAKTPGTLSYGLTAWPPSIKPWEWSGASSATVRMQLYRGLLSFDPDGNVRPELASEWRAEGDRAYVFKLRDNVKFHNGDPLTVADVKYSFEQIAGERSTAQLRTELSVIDSIEEIAPLTLRLNLKRPNATLPMLLATVNASIVSHKTPANAQIGIGCGPFTIADTERGVRYEMTPFRDFYKPGLPRLQRVRFIAYTDDSLRQAALEAGDVDLIEYVPWPSMESTERSGELKLEARDGAFMHLIFNFRQGPFTDVRLRQAAAFAVDREAIVRAAFSGRGSVLESIPIPRDSPYFTEGNAHFWRRNLDRARSLLREAGHPNGFSTSLLSTAQFAMHKDTAEITQQGLREIGVQVELRLPEWGTRVTLGNRGQYEFAVMGSAGEFNDPDALTQWLSPGLTPSYGRSFGYESPRMTELLEAGRATLDVERRKAVYDQMERLAQTDAPQVGLAWRSQGYGFWRHVRGFTVRPGFLFSYAAISVEEVTIA
jgi:peptide/nickel transport system substrate-binding protein